MREEICSEYKTKLLFLSKDDPCYEAKKEYLKNKMNEFLDAVDSFEQKMKRERQRRKFQDIVSRIADAMDSRKTIMILEFNNRKSASIKSFAVKKNGNIKVTTRILFGKVLMFAKLSLMSFIYEVLETFCFPDGNVRAILNKKVGIYCILEDTDSTSLKFIFISDRNSQTPESKFR